ncbi:MAG TPA: hypothetical protein VK626_06105, partial [Nitrospiraceae bacterium]|nr:hypothetical protein [Nitrospiraceae bacterium]
MLKKARLLTRPTLARRDAPGPQQGRSERKGEAYSVPYVEPLGEARRSWRNKMGGESFLAALSTAPAGEVAMQG